MLALQCYGLTRLPAKAKQGDLWSDAVVLTRKTDGKEYYAVQGTDRNGNLVIKRDFEDVHSVMEILAVYPTVRIYPKIDGKLLDKVKRERKVSFLDGERRGFGFVPSLAMLEGMDDEGIDELCVRMMRLRESAMKKLDQHVAGRDDEAKEGGEA